MSTQSDPRYPIGKFVPPAETSIDAIRVAVSVLAEFPERLREAVDGLSPEQFDTPYRQGGWTVQQVVHHVADSHSTALFRVKKALTEDWPTLPGYNEAEFAKLADMGALPSWSLDLIQSVHGRWVMLLEAFDYGEWKRGFVHSERGRMPLDFVTLNYAWHSAHHLAHINHLRLREGW